MIFPFKQEILAKISPADAKYQMLALLVVAFTTTFLISYIVSQSRIIGIKLFGAMMLLTWGTQSFMTQVETVVFIKAFPDLSLSDVGLIVIRGLLLYLFFLPMVMLIYGKWKQLDENQSVSKRNLKLKWYYWLPVIAVSYVVIYTLCGFFPISFQETKDFYTSWSTGLSMPEWLRLWSIQIVRGLLWFACVVPLFFILNGSKEKKIAVAAILLAVMTSFQLMFPNGLMPPVVRFGHFTELFFSMLIFGAITAWMVVEEDEVNQE
jgi:hypothetical protein